MPSPRTPVPALFTLALLTQGGCSFFTEEKAADTGGAGSSWTPSDTGPLWDSDTGDPDGLTCPQPTGAISLAEAWDRDWARIWFDGEFNVENESPHDIEMERWHLFFTPMSQDTAAGSADIDWATETASGQLAGPGDRWRHASPDPNGPPGVSVPLPQRPTSA